MKKSIGAKSLIYPNPVLLIGTYDQEGKPNLMTVSWGGVCCSDPPCIAVSVRQARFTYRNLLDKKEFTINIPSENHVNQADYCGIYSGRDENKFESTGLTAIKSDLIDAPFVQEFPISLICKLKDILEVGVHTQFIGEVIDILADESVLNDKNSPIIEKVKPICYDFIGKGYYSIGRKLIDGFTNYIK